MQRDPAVEAAALTTVQPERVAGKIAAIRNYQLPRILDQMEANPRLVELMWFLQGMSLLEGGLRVFSSRFLQRHQDAIGTPEMHGVEGKRLSLTDRVKIWKGFPDRLRPSLRPDRSGYDIDFWTTTPEQEVDQQMVKDPAWVAERLSGFDLAQCRDLCLAQAREELPFALAALCVDHNADFRSPWYFPNLIPALIQFMDRHAEDERRRIAKTDVTERVFEALDCAYETRIMTEIRGNSRFGKTQALRTWCAMWPGRVRLVTVPASDSLRDFFRAIAEALGMRLALTANPQVTRDRIGQVLRSSGMFLVFDEAAFLVPQTYTRTTAPHRMNWVRTELFDRGLPVAIAVTPQWYDGREGALTKFVRKTQYTVEQFVGRCEKVTLPETVSEEDLLRVAQFHFPEVSSAALLAEIAARAACSDNYLQAVENLAKRARFIARRAGKKLTDRSIEQVLNDMLPAPQEPQTEAPEVPLQGRLQPTAKRGQSLRFSHGHRRETSPVMDPGGLIPA